MRAPALALDLLAACGPAPTLMDYHRSTLDELARGMMDCPLDELSFEDSTPEGFPHMANDPESRRYTVRGCGHTAAFVCFTLRQSPVNERPECRPLRRDEGTAGGGVYLGPRRVN